ncbi:MAG: response regulator [Vallitaleaceae bacterium]|nr:response regulator [Vallitaleaceae bacterium]
MEQLKILLVESCVITRMATLEVVNSIEYSTVERATSDGGIALEWLEQCDIDVVLLDVAILRKEGLDLIKRIKKNDPHVEILVMENDDPESLSLTLDALKAGALDFVQKLPEKDLKNKIGPLKAQLQTLFSQILLNKYSGLSRNKLAKEDQNTMRNESASANSREQIRRGTVSGKTKLSGDVDLILIASSTGGPVALDTLFSTLSPKITQPILIVQHMPPGFTHIMAQKLQDKYKLPITEGIDGGIVTRGKIILAKGGLHMTLETTPNHEKIIRLKDQDFVNGVKPSADVLFQSVTDVYKGKNILVVVLTGMGNDGTQGISKLKKSCNCYCITQSESTCVVYGMPKCVYEAGFSDEVADISDIAFRIHQIALERGGQ